MKSIPSFADLKKNLKKDYSGLPTIKVALLGDNPTQLLHQSLRATGFEYAFDLQIWEADFNQIEQQVIDLSSTFYQSEFDIIIVFHCTHKLLDKYNKSGFEEQKSISDTRMLLIENIVSTLKTRTAAKIIYYNYNEIDDSVFGGYANQTPASFLYQLRRLNYQLMEYATSTSNFYICDLSAIQNQLGKLHTFQPSIYVNTDMVLHVDSLPLVASRTVDIIGAIYGKFKKCIIVDLDNTLWGGIVGDDGIERLEIGNFGIGKAYSELQHWLKKLKVRGVILAVCSKNTESIAKMPFEQHPDMVLKLDDFAIFMANWDNKAENIEKIRQQLNVSFDSMVFLDDNPFERDLVRKHIPSMTVPELPEDPAIYLEYLYSLNLFETISFTGEDQKRTKQYQQNAARMRELTSFVNEDAYLASLNMRCQVDALNKYNLPRVAQLSQRSNQFNLRTIRYTELELNKMMNEQLASFTFAFSLADKFGDNGLVCVVILKQESEKILFIDSWFMSCRVLKRGMENFVLNTLFTFAQTKGFEQLKGEYLPTTKNELVKNHYSDLGFKREGQYWLLQVFDYEFKKTFIQIKTDDKERITS